MQYVKKSDQPNATASVNKTVVVHTLGQMPETGDEQQKGSPTETGPKGAEMFPSTDEWAGKPVTGDYQTIPEDKDAVEENLRTAGEEVQKRFGLETRGVDITPPGEPNKPSDTEGK